MLVLAWLVATDGPLPAIVALAIVAACFSTLFYPAIASLIPNLVSDETEFGPANSAWATFDSLAFVVGPAIGGVLVAVSGLTLAFLLNAASFAAVAVVLWTLPAARTRRAALAPEAPEIEADRGRPQGPKLRTPRPDVAVPGPEAPASETPVPATPAPAPEAPAPTPEAPPTAARAGWGVLRSRAVGGVVIVDATALFAYGGVSILLVILATDVYHAGEAATGYLNAAIGVGSVAGALDLGGPRAPSAAEPRPRCRQPCLRRRPRGARVRRQPRAGPRGDRRLVDRQSHRGRGAHDHLPADRARRVPRPDRGHHHDRRDDRRGGRLAGRAAARRARGRGARARRGGPRSRSPRSCSAPCSSGRQRTWSPRRSKPPFDAQLACPSSRASHPPRSRLPFAGRSPSP